jgi:hypothetical protein
LTGLPCLNRRQPDPSPAPAGSRNALPQRLRRVVRRDYLAFAFEEYDYSSLEDPEVFAALERNATKVSLARGESKTLNLKLLPWPEQFADRLR